MSKFLWAGNARIRDKKTLELKLVPEGIKWIFNIYILTLVEVLI